MTSCPSENIILSLYLFPLGPFIKPIFLNEPVRVYYPELNRNLIGTDNRKRVVIYQWTNLINGKIYIGSASTGSTRLLNYFNPNIILRNLPVYNSFRKYGHNNFCLAILEDLGSIQQTSKKFILEREQYYLDIIFTKYLDKILNLSPTAGTNLGFKHNFIFRLNRKGTLNPMFGKNFSPEFISSRRRSNAKIDKKKGIFESSNLRIFESSNLRIFESSNLRFCAEAQKRRSAEEIILCLVLQNLLL